jgi:hypothetical protein
MFMYPRRDEGHLRLHTLLFVSQDDDESDEDEETVGGEVRTGRDVDDGEEAREEGLHPQEIDAYWLQRQITRAYGDAIDADESQRLAEEVFATLQVREHVWALCVPYLCPPFSLHVPVACPCAPLCLLFSEGLREGGGQKGQQRGIPVSLLLVSLMVAPWP